MERETEKEKQEVTEGTILGWNINKLYIQIRRVQGGNDLKFKNGVNVCKVIHEGTVADWLWLTAPLYEYS